MSDICISLHFLDLLFRDEIPHRDYLMCRVGLILIIFLTSFESRRPRKRLTSKRFRKTFATLSAMEVVFTIVLPWMIILQGIMNIDKKETSRNGHLFAPHLFIFQAQIAFECIIVLAGEQRKWLMFPFTCVSNAYRGITLGTWIMRGEMYLHLLYLILVASSGSLLLLLFCSVQ